MLGCEVRHTFYHHHEERNNGLQIPQVDRERREDDCGVLSEEQGIWTCGVGRGDGRDKSVAGVPHSLHEEEGKIVNF